MRIDEMPLPSTLPTALRERTELARSLRARASMCAIAEGLVILASGFPADVAFRSPVTLARIEDQEGPAAVEAYEAAVRRIESSLEEDR